MEAGGLQPSIMNWNMLPGLFKQTLGFPTVVVPPKVWKKMDRTQQHPVGTEWSFQKLLARCCSCHV